MLGNHEDADDVLQNTLVKAYKGLKNFRGDAKLFSWLYRIASNESLTFIEKRKRHRTISIDDSSEPAGNTSVGPGPEEIQAALRSAIDQLPPKQQLVFNLKYFEELKYEQISELTGTSVGALKSSYHIAVKKIEQFLVGRSNL
jgi:RNA polymerase sigma-70 factor (ECF subfamily)